MTTTIAFALASWRPEAPAGMERAVAAHAVGLQANGHQPIIITADPTAPSSYRGITIVGLGAVAGSFPCDDNALRDRITFNRDALGYELTSLFDRCAVDVAIYVDALWGLGRVMPRHPPTRNVLAVHVVGHDIDLTAALACHPDRVIAPSRTVLDQAAARGYDTAAWKVVPNSLMNDPPAVDDDRDRLRLGGPIRVLARLGPEKGIRPLIAAHTDLGRPVEIALAHAGFEDATGSQRRLLDDCRTLAATRPGLRIVPGLSWDETSDWLREAAAVVVPSLAETFGLVALEALAVGAPVISYDIGNLPNIVGDGGIQVPHDSGPGALWRAARQLLDDPVQYLRTSRAAYYRSRDYWPALVADQLLKVVS